MRAVLFHGVVYRNVLAEFRKDRPVALVDWEASQFKGGGRYRDCVKWERRVETRRSVGLCAGRLVCSGERCSGDHLLPISRCLFLCACLQRLVAVGAVTRLSKSLGDSHYQPQ